VDPQFKTDILIAMGIGFVIMVVLRQLPRIQSRMMGIPFIDNSIAKSKIDAGGEMLVLDVRTPGEFTGDLGHIQGALNLDSQRLHEKLAELGDALEEYKDQPILITCRTHNRSPKAARILFQNGFKKLSILEGGMMGWNRAGYPVEKG
jgi:rhodanese-related sulfurtransferase